VFMLHTHARTRTRALALHCAASLPLALALLSMPELRVLTVSQHCLHAHTHTRSCTHTQSTHTHTSTLTHGPVQVSMFMHHDLLIHCALFRSGCAGGREAADEPAAACGACAHLHVGARPCAPALLRPRRAMVSAASSMGEGTDDAKKGTRQSTLGSGGSALLCSTMTPRMLEIIVISLERRSDPRHS
jgi:hypothetical protein